MTATCYTNLMSIRLPKIFLDSGDPEETRKAKGLLGTIDGQTTNPSLVAKNPEVQKMLAAGKKLTETELFAFYKEVVGEISRLLAGPVSVEVYADWKSTAAQMLKQAEDMATWGINVYVKFPAIPEGLKAANEFVKKGGKANMTLVFDQVQAAAVFAATQPGTFPSFVSPFIGRWDDRGYRGMDLVKNIIKMYKVYAKRAGEKRPHVQVLAASIRTLDHYYASIFMGADAMTVPLKILSAWVQEENWMPDEHYRMPSTGLKALLFEQVPYSKDFSSYAVSKEPGSLLDEGLEKFIKDWKSLIKTK